MRKFIPVLLMLAILLFTLTACNDPKLKNGTYKSDELISQTWTFSGTNDVTWSAGITLQGTYEINGETLIVKEKTTGIERDFKITEITPTSFFLDGTKFIKQ